MDILVYSMGTCIICMCVRARYQTNDENNIVQLASSAARRHCLEIVS